MSNPKSTALQNAYELIERGELEAAQEILVPLLESAADDASIWWVYAHAVRDGNIGQAALRRVLELDPHYPGARELAQDLDQIEAPHFTAEPLWANESAPTPNAVIEIDEWEDLQPAVGAPKTTQSSRIGTTVLVAALLLLIVGGALIATGAVDINQLLSGSIADTAARYHSRVGAGEPQRERYIYHRHSCSARKSLARSDYAGTSSRQPRANAGCNRRTTRTTGN